MYITELHCYHCKTRTVHANGECIPCKQEREEKQRIREEAEFLSLSTEDKFLLLFRTIKQNSRQNIDNIIYG